LNPSSFAQVESKLPEQLIDAVSDDGGKSCPGSVIQQRGQSEGEHYRFVNGFFKHLTQ
jgi:hypothetical protein